MWALFFTLYLQVCGTGASSCVGTVRNPDCKCKTDEYYVASENGRSCVLGMFSGILSQSTMALYPRLQSPRF